MKIVNVFRSANPNSFSVGWKRDDAPMVHVFAQADQGEKFTPTDGHGGPHWPCTVCSAHNYTEEMFFEQILDALDRGPLDHR